ncbi:biotin-dependent carboxyltransferase family protein [Salipaludibacillus aurantiacus]|uniref:Antagonist of KipI n=1 Tax=Salipaludibacillus aurantiacus TaxID=1601833 RepID=A0A1H9V9V3_9BACI|nr:biotin-dependent carboxyltransferase family protein [Salipaludibacillus aurantiacus]SES18348.1 antagonist of KipI [Salipaludibacillus aurantiacus]
MIPLIKIEEPGLHTTIQDTGRYGMQQYGVVPSGPMDPFAFRIANLLAGNAPDDAAIEITMVGPSVRFLENCVIAITGANLSPTLDGRKVPVWGSLYVKKGQELQFGKPKHGVRAYLAIAGGIHTQKVLQSRATYTKAELGGLKGQPLETGDELPGLTLPDTELSKRKGKLLSEKLRPYYQSHHMVRVIPDEQESYFTKEALQTFYTHSFKVTPQSDRMGYRLQGQKIGHKQEAEILSEAVAFGSIQVPADGAPIILMADRQTTGGYPKIGTIITHDLWKVAQLMPGHTLSFQRSSVEEGHLWHEYETNLLKKLSVSIQQK